MSKTDNNLHGMLIDSDFQPPWWAKNRHVQTIWPRFFQRRKPFSAKIERLNLPDGDFVDLAWGQQAQVKGVAIVFHGLEGSIKSHYANDLMAELQAQGWLPVLMHFRGCSHEHNLTPRAYHSGETEDPLFFLDWLEVKYPNVPKVAIGFSLGANMLLKLLGENPQQKHLQAAVAVSAPLKLWECSSSINQGLSRFYQSYLMKSMTRNLVTKMATIDYRQLLKIDLSQANNLKTFREFDEHVTAPLHGFKDADDYYQQCSASQFLNRIITPTLVLHAKDDPFMNPSVVPLAQELAPAVRVEISDKGGHVGFMQGTPWRPKIWLHSRISQYLNQYLPEG